MNSEKLLGGETGKIDAIGHSRRTSIQLRRSEDTFSPMCLIWKLAFKNLAIKPYTLQYLEERFQD